MQCSSYILDKLYHKPTLLQVPVFCGLYTMERLASRASGLLGRTGRHLFLRDRDDGKAPILLRMSRDSEDLKFM